jgi:hypothetical protein
MTYRLCVGYVAPGFGREDYCGAELPTYDDSSDYCEACELQMSADAADIEMFGYATWLYRLALDTYQPLVDEPF